MPSNTIFRQLPPTGSELPIKELSGQIVDWQQALEQRWEAVRFGDVKFETKERHIFEVQVYLDDLDPKEVRVELYADGVTGSAPVRQEMKLLPTGRRVGRLRLQRGCVCGWPTSGLYGASDTALLQRCDSSGTAHILWQR